MTDGLYPSKKQKTVTFKLEEDSETDVSTYKVEADWLPNYKMEHIVICFEMEPVWLLAVSDAFTRHLISPQFNSLYGLKKFIFDHTIQSDLYLSILSKLSSTISLWFGQTDHSPILHLLSSATHFWDKVVPKVQTLNRAVGVYENYCDTRNSSKYQDVKTIKHVWVGGATRFKTVFITSNPSFIPAFTRLRRSLGAFLNFKYKVVDRSPTTSRLYNTGDTISLDALPVFVALPLTYSPGESGHRRIQKDELSHLLGLPSDFCLDSSKSVKNFIPVQILDGLIASVLTPRTISRTPMVAVASEFTPTPIVVNPKGVFLSSLGRFLPHTWSNQIETSMSAAKNDDAALPLHLWNNVLSLCFHT